MLHETVQEIQATLRGIEEQETPWVEANFVERVDALDGLSWRILERIENVQYVHGYHTELASLYHRGTQLWQRLEAVNAQLPGPILHLSIHSFTPELHGKKRDLDLGILFDPDRPLEAGFARALQPRILGFDVRENEPYDGRADGLCTAFRTRFPEEAYAGIEIEISHRLLEKLDRVSRALIEAIRSLIED